MDRDAFMMADTVADFLAPAKRPLKTRGIKMQRSTTFTTLLVLAFVAAGCGTTQNTNTNTNTNATVTASPSPAASQANANANVHGNMNASEHANMNMNANRNRMPTLVRHHRLSVRSGWQLQVLWQVAPKSHSKLRI